MTTHETTWRDIARGYRDILTQIINAFANTYGKEVMEKLVSMVEAIDTEADLLATREQVEEYTDELTGMRLTIKHDHPEHPLITVHGSKNHVLSMEQFNAALGRLRDRARLTVADFPDPYTLREK